MIEKLKEINEGLQEFIPLMLFISWLLMVVFAVKLIINYYC